jgi:hypothetical protein
MANTYGAQAGRLVRQRWSAEPGDPVPTAWREQRWVRLHTLVEGLRDFVRGTAAGDAHTAHSVSLDQALRDARVDGGGDAPLRDPNSDTHLTASQAEALGRLRDALRDLETTFANDLEPQPFRPEPRPELKRPTGLDRRRQLPAQSRGRNVISIVEGTRPSTSRGSVSVRSIARSTASSHSRTPLERTSRRPTIVPSGAARTSTSATGLPSIVSGKTMFGLMRALMRPA